MKNSIIESIKSINDINKLSDFVDKNDLIDKPNYYYVFSNFDDFSSRWEMTNLWNFWRAVDDIKNPNVFLKHFRHSYFAPFVIFNGKFYDTSNFDDLKRKLIEILGD